jgi:hypothetical protein
MVYMAHTRVGDETLELAVESDETSQQKYVEI